MSTRILSAFVLLIGYLRAGLMIINPTELADSFGDKGEVVAKLSNVGYLNFQKGTSRIGQLVTPFVKDN